MKKKQLFALAMAGVMSAGLLAGCGGGESSAAAGSGSTASGASTEETTCLLYTSDAADEL